MKSGNSWLNVKTLPGLILDRSPSIYSVKERSKSVSIKSSEYWISLLGKYHEKHKDDIKGAPKSHDPSKLVDLKGIRKIQHRKLPQLPVKKKMMRKKPNDIKAWSPLDSDCSDLRMDSPAKLVPKDLKSRIKKYIIRHESGKIRKVLYVQRNDLSNNGSQSPGCESNSSNMNLNPIFNKPT